MAVGLSSSSYYTHCGAAQHTQIHQHTNTGPPLAVKVNEPLLFTLNDSVLEGNPAGYHCPDNDLFTTHKRFIQTGFQRDTEFFNAVLFLTK